MEPSSSSQTASWRKSRRCNGSSACVEVASLGADVMAIRDSVSVASSLSLSGPAWSAFIAQVKDGFFDLHSAG
jgi:hypothetical protein